MYLDEFAARLHQLEDPYTDVQTRHAADQWLTQFRDSPHAWTTAQAALTSANPSLLPHAAQVLAYKCKRQLVQIEAIEHRIALLQTLSTTLASLSSSATATISFSRAVTQALCVAISNLIIQLPTLPRPLETMVSLLDQQTMLEFLTILPGECDDAYAALQASTATNASEASFELKERAGTWSIEVGHWLYTIINSMVQSQPQFAAFLDNSSNNSTRSGGGNFQEFQPPMLIYSISCFAAWIKWGGLFTMGQEHWEYMLWISSAVLFGSKSGSSSAAAVAVAVVEVLIEAIERPSPPSQRIVLEICLRVSQYICTAFPLGSTLSSTILSKQYKYFSHVFTTYCSTNASTVASSTSEGAVLRNGVLHLVALAGEKTRLVSGSNSGDNNNDAADDEDESGGVPALDTLCDILEVIVDSQVSEDDDDDSIDDVVESTATLTNVASSGGSGSGSVYKKNNKNNDEIFSIKPLAGQERIHFTSTVLSVLLQFSQAPVPYLLGSESVSFRSVFSSQRAPALPTGLKLFRMYETHALTLISEILSVETFMYYIHSFFQGCSTHSGQLDVKMQALEVCLFAIQQGAAVFGAEKTESFYDNSKGPPAWLDPLLFLYYTAQELASLQQHHSLQGEEHAPRLTQFHYIVLASFVAVAKPLMNALVHMPDQCRGLILMIFKLSEAAIRALPATSKTSMNGENILSGGFDHEEQHWEEDESVLEAATHAVRAVVSTPHDIQTITLDTGAIQVIDTMLAALITTSTTASTATATTSGFKQRDAAERKASQHLLVALVHVLYHTDQNKASNALHVLRNRALGPLLAVANEASHSTSSSSFFNLVKLSAFFEDSMAFLNALESHRDHLDLYLDLYGTPSSSTVDIAVRDAVSTCLAVWPTTLTALSQAPTTTTATTALCSTIYQDASQCLCSCIVLAPTSITSSLKPLLESTFSSIFLPGGHSMHRILCELFRMTTNEEGRVDVSSITAKYEQISTLVAALGSLLTHPLAQKFHSLGGGDSDPDAVCALLTIATCFLREISSTQWNAILTNIRSQASAGGGGGDGEAVVSPFVECVDLSLRLAAANTACNHRGVCHSAISTLLAASKLLLDTSCTALRTPLLQYISQVQSYCTTSSTINGTIGNTNGIDNTSNNNGGGGGGVVMMQGIMLCMLSLQASSFLQKILTLLTNAAELAKTCSEASLLSQQIQSVHITNYGEETNVEVQCIWICLQEWWNTARILLLKKFPKRAEGVAGESTAAAAAIINSLNLRALAAAVSGGNTPTEARRGIQRAVRPVTDQIRRNHHVG